MGSSLTTDLERIRSELSERGFTAHRTPGPLLIATQGGRFTGRTKFKSMPIMTSSTYKANKEILERALDITMDWLIQEKQVYNAKCVAEGKTL